MLLQPEVHSSREMATESGGTGADVAYFCD